MSAALPAAEVPAPVVRAIFVRGAVVGAAAGIVCGAALAVALTRPVAGMLELVRGRVLGGELHEPQFELLN